jgi:outer membrane lipopolysaccharide assembly protein LptE/RlpB
MKNRLLLSGSVLAALALAASCGYHLSGHGDLMPASAKTVAIAFRNGTTRYDLARMLPAEVTREFLTRTRYKVVDDRNQADVVLEGIVANVFPSPTTSDPATGRATGALIVVQLNLTLTERATGKLLWSRNGWDFRERYEVSTDPQAYFDESTPAMQRLSQDVARAVVSTILEHF